MMTEEMLEELWHQFKNLGESALSMSHYDLSKTSAIDDPHLWRLFLMDPDVSDWIRAENALLQEAELNKLIKDIGNSNSVGKAQLINTLTTRTKDASHKSGPMFIYTYIPLNSEQENAPNVTKLTSDPFII